MNFDKSVNSFEKFSECYGKTVWLVTNPLIDNVSEQYGNSFISEWVVDFAYDTMGEKITDLNHCGEAFSPHKTKQRCQNSVIHKFLLPIHHFNVIKEYKTNYNNRIFYNESDANEYRMWLVMKYKNLEMFKLISESTVYCYLLEWDKFLKEGFDFGETLS